MRDFVENLSQNIVFDFGFRVYSSLSSFKISKKCVHCICPVSTSADMRWMKFFPFQMNIHPLKCVITMKICQHTNSCFT